MPSLSFPARLSHYYDIRGTMLDGLRVIEDIALPDSYKRPILVLPDGSYVLQENGKKEICGEAWWIRNGEMRAV